MVARVAGVGPPTGDGCAVRRGETNFEMVIALWRRDGQFPRARPAALSLPGSGKSSGERCSVMIRNPVFGNRLVDGERRSGFGTLLA